MLAPSAEQQLVLFTALLYMYDASLLLDANEGIATRRAGSWKVFSAAKGMLLRGRHLWVPQLLLPHQAIYRLSWDYAQWRSDKPCHAPPPLALHRGLATLCYSMGILLFALLPALLWVYHSDEALLACATAVYTVALVAGGLVMLRRERWGLSAQRARSLALECIFCPPFTINLIRKISLEHPLPTNLVQFAHAVLHAHDWDMFKTEAQELLQFQIDEEDAPERKAALTLSMQALAQVEK